jgi:hypothetical protein
MKNIRKGLQELDSRALGMIQGGMDLSHQRPSTNVEQWVWVGNWTYVYDYQGNFLRMFYSPQPPNVP